MSSMFTRALVHTHTCGEKKPFALGAAPSNLARTVHTRKSSIAADSIGNSRTVHRHLHSFSRRIQSEKLPLLRWYIILLLDVALSMYMSLGCRKLAWERNKVERDLRLLIFHTLRPIRITSGGVRFRQGEGEKRGTFVSDPLARC